MITPIEIRQQQFKKSLRGYDKEEVQAFLLALSQEWERQLDAHRALREELDRMRASYKTLKDVEDMLHKTLMQAEQSSRDTLDNARQKAELKLREADVRAREILRQGIDERTKLEREIADLTRHRDQVLSQLQIFLKGQLERLGMYDLQPSPAADRPSLYPSDPMASFDDAVDETEARSHLLDDIVSEL
ncbi:MAG: DivIVA domain-containing protein [Bacteroidia bacterium]|nr:DivIVA domain-containing protein [Bacteroidia bacterium]